MKSQAEIAVNREKAMAEILKNYYAERPEEAREFLSRAGLLGSRGNTSPVAGGIPQDGGGVVPQEMMA